MEKNCKRFRAPLGHKNLIGISSFSQKKHRKHENFLHSKGGFNLEQTQNTTGESLEEVLIVNAYTWSWAFAMMSFTQEEVISHHTNK